MIILGIESSCDETAVAIVKDGTEVLSSVITSTKDVFADAGGVVPEDAARRQVECILPVLHSALKKANISTDDLDAIAVTRGPGLLGSLLVGTVTARTIATLWKKPLIGVHHTFGHLSSTWLKDVSSNSQLSTLNFSFPIITLSVSGGHTDLWYRTSHTKGTLLGRTRDDAAGEAFDKGASMLGFPYPGGPSIAKASEDGDEHAFDLPIALKNEDTLDFSFSGVKTALRNTIQKKCEAPASPAGRRSTKHEISDLAASYQFALCGQLCDRLRRATEKYTDAKEVHLVGGVSANTRLRELVHHAVPHLTVRHPATIQYCTDNAAMIAAGGFFLAQELGNDAYAAFETLSSIPLESCVS